WNLRNRLQATEHAIDVTQCYVGIEVPNHHEDNVVRRIEGVEEGAALLHAHRLDIAAPADHRPTVGMGDKGEREERLEEPSLGIVLGAKPALLEHDLALAREGLFADVEIRDALRFKIDRKRKGVGRHVFVEDGDVVGGVGVYAAATRLEQPRVLFGWDIQGALEHHVL